MYTFQERYCKEHNPLIDHAVNLNALLYFYQGVEVCIFVKTAYVVFPIFTYVVADMFLAKTISSLN